MSPRLVLAFATAALALSAYAGCDSDGSGPNGGPLTNCDFNYVLGDANLKGYGEACSSNNECAYGVCLTPGTAGNITNNQFGFCTRGCDCDNATASQLTADEKIEYSCVYVTGFQGAKRHVVPKCSNSADCTDIAPGWSECGIPVGVDRICLAP